jgi:hypothetical protein
MSELSFIAVLSVPVKAALDMLLPFLDPFLPNDTRWRPLVIRLLAGLVGAFVMVFSGEHGVVQQMDLLRELPFWLAVVIAGAGVAGSSSIVHLVGQRLDAKSSVNVK